MKPRLVLTGRLFPRCILATVCHGDDIHIYNRALQYQDRDRFFVRINEWYYEYSVQYQTPKISLANEAQVS